ncbi:MAG: VWA domain-containing protein [Deltaproteobacteria bacterium]|nr:VWA domain-containing protein [Deltaproteobacteria bacterium]
MTFGTPLPLPLLAQAAGILGALVIAAYILKLRRRRFEVPFSKLWQRVLRENETTSLWRRLKRIVSLLVQLLFLSLILGAALDPKVGVAQANGRNVVVLIDASASMKTLDDGKTTRLARAKEAAIELVRGLGGDDAAMIIQMDGQPSAVSRFETDRAQLVTSVDKVKATDTPAALVRALGTAADALRGRKHPMIVIVGDGAYPEDARRSVSWEGEPTSLGLVDLRGIDVRFVSIGKESRNVGVTSFSARRYLESKLSYEVLLEVQNFGERAETVTATLLAGDDPIHVKTLALVPGERKREIFPDLGGGTDRALRVELKPELGPDPFPLDDVAHALLPEQRKQRVLLVTTDNLYLEGALLLDDKITVEKLSPSEYEKEAATLPAYDVMVFDGWSPVGSLPSPALIFNPPRTASLIPVAREVARPLITDVEKDHPVTRWVTLADVNIDRSLVFSPADGDVVLAHAVRDPLVVAGKRHGKKVVVLGFGLEETDLMLRVAFPVLVVNTLAWFAGDDAELITTYRTGHAWSIPVDEGEGLTEVTVQGPTRVTRAPVMAGRARFYGSEVGVYRISGENGASLALAANLANPVESSIKPLASLTLGGRPLSGAPTPSPSLSRSIWVYLVLAALVLSAIEWLTYNRRITA